MKVYFDHQAFSVKTAGGVARYFAELGAALHRRREISAAIVCPIVQSSVLADSDCRVPVIGINISGIAKLPDRAALSLNSFLVRTVAAAARPDILHETYYSMKRSAPRSARVVTTIHDTIPELFPDMFPQSEVQKDLIRTVLNRADWVLCVSESTRRDMLRIYDFDPDRISVTHLGVSIRPSKRPPICLDRPYFLHVGARYPYKNFNALIEAFAKSGLYRSHALVSFSWNAFAEQEFDAMRRYGVSTDHVIHTTGNDDTLARYYAGAEALVVPSFYEGFGLPVVEAMSCGCPILSSNAGSLPEVAGDAAIYFDPRDTDGMARAMLAVASSPEERARLRSCGLNRATQFSWDHCAETTLAAYRRVLDLPKFGK